MKWITAALTSLLLVSCTSSQETRLAEYRVAMTQLDILRSQYPAVEAQPVRSYLAYLGGRLTSHKSTGSRYKIELLKSQERFAYHLGSGIVVLSTGLVRSLGNEAQLAFLIAHEIAHGELEHTALARHDYHRGLSPVSQADLEIEADKHALGIVAMAGYDPRVSVYALYSAYYGRSRNAPTTDLMSYPSFEERISQIATTIRNSGWKPPGVVQKREFVKFQRLLNGIG